MRAERVGQLAWWVSCGVAVIDGVILVMISDGRFFAHWGVALGVGLVIGTGVVLWQRAWRARHPELAAVPLLAVLAAFGMLNAARGEWVAATGGAVAGIGLVGVMAVRWWAQQVSEAGLDDSSVSGHEALSSTD